MICTCDGICWTAGGATTGAGCTGATGYNQVNRALRIISCAKTYGDVRYDWSRRCVDSGRCRDGNVHSRRSCVDSSCWRWWRGLLDGSGFNRSRLDRSRLDRCCFNRRSRSAGTCCRIKISSSQSNQIGLSRCVLRVTRVEADNRFDLIVRGHIERELLRGDEELQALGTGRRRQGSRVQVHALTANLLHKGTEIKSSSVCDGAWCGDVANLLRH